MSLLVAIDPGAHSAVAMLVYGELKVFDCTDEKQLRHVFSSLYSRSLSEHKAQTFIGIEQVHTIQGIGSSNNFAFGKSVGFWEGVLTYLNFPWKTISIKNWQEATVTKPPKPDISGLTEKEIQKAKYQYKRDIKEASLKAARKAFPKVEIATHDLADAVNMVRYVQHKMKGKV